MPYYFEDIAEDITADTGTGQFYFEDEDIGPREEPKQKPKKKARLVQEQTKDVISQLSTPKDELEKPDEGVLEQYFKGVQDISAQGITGDEPYFSAAWQGVKNYWGAILEESPDVAKGYGKGLVKGATLGAIDMPTESEAEKAGAGVGDFVGMALPLTKALQVGGAMIKSTRWASKLTPFQMALTETATGGAVYAAAEGAATGRPPEETLKRIPLEASLWTLFTAGVGGVAAGVGKARAIPGATKRLFEKMGQRTGKTANEVAVEVAEEAKKTGEMPEAIVRRKINLLEGPPDTVYYRSVKELSEKSGLSLKEADKLWKQSAIEQEQAVVTAKEAAERKIMIDKVEQLREKWTPGYGKRPSIADAMRNEEGTFTIGRDKIFKHDEKTAVRQTMEKVDYLLGVLSTRVGNISEPARDRLKRHAYDKAVGTSRSFESVKPFVKKLKKKITPEDHVLVTMHLRNQDFPAALEIFRKYKVADKEFQVALETIDSIANRAKAEGVPISKVVEHYWPSRIKNYEGYVEHLKKTGRTDSANGLERAIKQMEKEFPELTAEERGAIADKVMRGFPQGKITLAKPSYAKERTSGKIGYEDAKFYEGAVESLESYVYHMETAIANNRLFGKSKNPERADMIIRKILGDDYQAYYESVGITKREQVYDSIGGLVQEASPNLTNTQINELRSMIYSYLYPKSPGKLVRGTKSLTYTALLNDVGAALTQLQAFGITLGTQVKSPRDVLTLGGVLKDVALRRGRKLRDIGIDAARADFERKGVGKVAKFWTIPLRLGDVADKEILLNMLKRKNQRLAQEKSPKLVKHLKKLYGNNYKNVMDDMAKGNPTDDVLFAESHGVSNIHPISELETPQAYLNSEGWNAMLTLHTYQLKQVDVLRNLAYNQIKQGNIREGALNLFTVAAGLIGIGMPVNYAKDYVKGYETQDWDEYFVESALEIVGMNKYTFDRVGAAPASQKVETIIRGLSPAFLSVVSDVYEDAVNTAEYIKTGEKKPVKALRYGVPVIGGPIYGRTEAVQERGKRYSRLDMEEEIADALADGDYNEATKLRLEAFDKKLKLNNTRINRIVSEKKK